jgi:hypothetical protein
VLLFRSMGVTEKLASISRAGIIAVVLTVVSWFTIAKFTGTRPDAPETSFLFFVCYLASYFGDWLLKKLFLKSQKRPTSE